MDLCSALSPAVYEKHTINGSARQLFCFSAAGNCKIPDASRGIRYFACLVWAGETPAPVMALRSGGRIISGVTAKRRIDSVEILRVQMFRRDAERLAEALKMDDFPWRAENGSGSQISGSLIRRRMLSYVVRAFCSAARSSVRSVMGSPLDWYSQAFCGIPPAAMGQSPRV